MVELSADQLPQRAFDLSLIDERQLQEVLGHFRGRTVSGAEAQQLLLRREFLTNYQAERLLRGEKSGFFYGDYKVLYLIGTGTFARVYRAAHKTSGEIRAVKVLRKRYHEDSEQSSRFSREGEMGSTLRHPNIVPIYEVHAARDSHFLVMEFIEGRNLREFIKIRKKFEPAEALRLVIGIAGGLDYAFQRGVFHRDLKMSNVLVSSRGQAKLVDFGLANLDNASDDGESVNPRTIDYAGLERATGVRKGDTRSDIYFLGCIFYNLVTGTPPIYETKDRIQRLSRTRFEEVIPILEADPALPQPVAMVITKAMDLQASCRYQTPAEMLADLKLAGEWLKHPESAPAANVRADGDPVGPDEATEQDFAAVPATSPDQFSVPHQRTLMFVESDVTLQNLIRERLKRSGYRVLVTQDPDRALSRFSENVNTADCLVFSTGGLGESALEAFNRFGEEQHTRKIPAVLLLGEKHLAWKKQAKLDRHRVAVSMPIKLRQFRELLARLIPIAK